MKHLIFYPIGTFLLGVPIIYAYHLHPVYGFLIAFLFTWLILEDFFTQLIDLRVSIAFTAIIAAVHPQMICSAIFIYLFFQILYYAFARYSRPKDAADLTDPCPLQSNHQIGFVPLLGAASWIVLTIHMIWNPLGVLSTATMNGNRLAEKVYHTHIYIGSIERSLTQEPYIVYILLLCMLLIVAFLRWREGQKKKQGYIAYYSFGNGDSLVLASLTGLFGLECFYFVVLMLSVFLGELCRISAILQRRRLYEP